MKLLVTTLFILLILKGVCQSKEFENSFFETTPQYEDSVIILNWTNLIMGLEMSSVRFQTLVQSCHYKYSEAENSYFANTSAPSGHYTVNKKTDEFQMTWTNNKNYSSFLKNQMQNSFRGETDGWYYYRLTYGHDIGFVINIMLKNQGDNGIVFINRRPNVRPSKK